MRKISCVVLLLGLGLVFLASAGVAASPTKQYLKELQSRFSRSSEGIISDQKTGLRWLESPDNAMTWVQAQAWIEGLGKPWRTPTIEELKGIYLPESARQGAPFAGLPALNLHLDKAFANNSYMVWSVAKDSSLAWYFGFYDGVEYWNPRDTTIWRFRALAVSPSGKTSRKVK
ncbi:MAG: DUF1566 domain-containing protein [Candidatus Ozemobacteraceae bacterium]